MKQIWHRWNEVFRFSRLPPKMSGALVEITNGCFGVGKELGFFPQNQAFSDKFRRRPCLTDENSSEWILKGFFQNCWFTLPPALHLSGRFGRWFTFKLWCYFTLKKNVPHFWSWYWSCEKGPQNIPLPRGKTTARCGFPEPQGSLDHRCRGNGWKSSLENWTAHLFLPFLKRRFWSWKIIFFLLPS